MQKDYCNVVLTLSRLYRRCRISRTIFRTNTFRYNQVFNKYVP